MAATTQPSQVVQNTLNARTTYFRGKACNPLLNLPDELLEQTLSHLGNVDRICLQSASKRLYSFSSTGIFDLTGSERKDFSKAMWRDAYYKAVDLEVSGVVTASRRACSVCQATHRTESFSRAELEVVAPQRGCLSSERRLVICDHYSPRLVDIQRLDLAQPSCKRHSDLQGSYDGSQYVSFTCEHPTHTHDMLAHRYTTLPSLDILVNPTTGRPTSFESVRHYKLGSNALHAIQKGSNNPYYFALAVRSRLKSLNARLCPHFTTADKYITKHFGRNELLALVTDIDIDAISRAYGVSDDPVAPKIGTCTHPGCTMTFRFHREPVVLYQEQGQDQPSMESDDLWLQVKHCTLPFTVAADDPAWLACSVESCGPRVKALLSAALGHIGRLCKTGMPKVARY